MKHQQNFGENIGIYKIMVNTYSKKLVSLHSKQVRNLNINDKVKVVKIKVLPGSRIRGQLESGNWITIKNLESGKIIAQHVDNRQVFTLWEKFPKCCLLMLCFVSFF